VGIGVNAPSIAHEVNGKQHIVIATGSRATKSAGLPTRRKTKTVLKHMTMLFVFGL
jgi:hypothetical protein